MQKILSYILIVIFTTSTAFGQLQAYKKGLSSFEKGFYETAIQEFLKIKSLEGDEMVNLNAKIAEAYTLTNRPIEALNYYEKAFDGGFNNAQAYFNYAYGLKANGEYQKAVEYFKKYIDTQDNNQILQQRANSELNTLQVVEALNTKNKDIDLINLSSVNTDGSEFSPFLFKNNLIFTASRKTKTYSNGLPYLGIYKTNYNSEFSNLPAATVFSPSIFDEESNEGSVAISPDGKTLVFARGNTGKRKDFSPDVDLYISQYSLSNGWTNPKLISASDSASWDGSPCFSPNGNTLYFSSNRAGGVGGMDLYSVNMDASGRFGNPKNMGKALNTPGNEMFPFISGEGKMYFASDGHPGLGRLDLFEAVRRNGKISVENLGLPYNSSMDDFGLIIDQEGNTLLVSNRPGGKGDDDIYYSLAPKAVEEVVVEEVEPEPEPEKVVNYYLEGTIVSLDNKPLENASLSISSFEGGLESSQSSLTTNENGAFGPIKLEEGRDYVLFGEKSGFLAERKDFSMVGRSIPEILLTKTVTDTTFTTQLKLSSLFVGKTIKLENIYYDLDRYEIRDDAAIELDKVVQILNDNPGIKIELGSHTDIRGTRVYNQKLSQKRAESVIQYLEIKGIAPERLVAVGYGEEVLVIEDAKTEEEHQQNRRTEMKVLEIN